MKIILLIMVCLMSKNNSYSFSLNEKRQINIGDSQIALLTPNSGDCFISGSEIEIVWESTTNYSVKIEYFYNNTWVLIQDSIQPCISFYKWKIPNIESSNCRIRVSNIADANISDESDSSFTIVRDANNVIEKKIPTIKLLSPKAGDILRSGCRFKLVWQGEQLTTINFLYSTNNGNNWITVANYISANTEYYWTIPEINSEQCKARIVNSSLTSIFSENDSVFSIRQQSMSIIKPIKNERLIIGNVYNICWESIGIDSLCIAVTSDGGITWTKIAESCFADLHEFQWNVNLERSNECFVKITDLRDSTFSYISQKFITVSPNISIVAPIGNEVFYARETKQIKWSYTDVAKVNLEYSTNNGTDWINIVTGLNSTTLGYDWLIPNASSTNCLVRVSSSDDPDINDISDNTFSIFTPDLQVTSLNNFERIKSNSTIDITWQCAYIENVVIDYSTDNGDNWISIADSVSAVLGKYTWLVPDTESPNCKIKISKKGEPTLYDISDNTFTIYTPKISLSSLNGGEKIKVGTSVDITWSSENMNTIKIDYSTNNGTDWITLINNQQASEGKYTWVLPDSPSKQYIICVCDSLYPEIKDISENTFEVFKPVLVLSNPLGGNEYRIGTMTKITWECENIANVKIEFSIDNGDNWSIIDANYSANTKYYNWNIPNQPSTKCKIRIYDITDNNYMSVTDAFTLFNYPTQVLVAKKITFTDIYTPSSCKIIGLPGNVNIPVSETVTGTHKTDWNFYYDNGDENNYYVEYDGSDLFNFKPGRAFWVISKNGLNVSSAPSSVTIDGSYHYSISLHSGWNLISSPFEKSVSWQKVIQANGISLNPLLYSWNGSWNSAQNSMEPYEGYYFYNAHNKSELVIPYNPTGTILNKFAKSGALDKEFIKVDLLNDNNILSNISVSINDSSSTDFDEGDYYAAPGYFEDASIKLVENELHSKYKYLFVESKPLEKEGQMFDLQTINNLGNTLTIKCNSIGKEYDKYQIYLLDRRVNKFYNIREYNSVEVPKYYKENSYSLLIGTEDYINNIKAELLPSDYILYQNYPNPFNPNTVIRYSLPHESIISITLYNVIGEKVKDVVSTVQGAGYYETQLDLAGFASGVYFYQIQAKSISGGHNFNSTKKMVLLK